jgi:hypothetical protein
MGIYNSGLIFPDRSVSANIVWIYVKPRILMAGDSTMAGVIMPSFVCFGIIYMIE